MDISEFYRLALSRQSCREFLDKPIDGALLESITDTALLCPSACNSQPWRFYVLSGKSAKGAAQYLKLPNMNGFIDNCPAFIAIAEDRQGIPSKMQERFEKMQFVSIDTGIAAAHITLAATAAGLGSCILGGFREEPLREYLKEPGRIRLVIALGYAADGYPLREKIRRLPKPVTFLD